MTSVAMRTPFVLIIGLLIGEMSGHAEAARAGCTSSGVCRSPDGPTQQCEDDAGPPWVDDVEIYGKNKRYYDAAPATPILPESGDCPSPIAEACAAKGVKEAHLDGPVNCGGQGWFCRILPQEGWSDPDNFARGDANFAHCRTPNADNLDSDGHCHGSDDESVYGWWVRDHWFREYHGTLHCCCGWGEPMEGLVNRCDYRKYVSSSELDQCRDANEEHNVDFSPGCDGRPLRPEPVENGGQCWSVSYFGEPSEVNPVDPGRSPPPPPPSPLPPAGKSPPPPSPSPPPPASSSSPPSPSPPPPSASAPIAIPSTGVQVIEGRSGAFVKCLMPDRDEEITSAAFERETIATQCCDSGGECFRHLGTNDNADETGCLAGFSAKPAPYIEAYTYGEAAAMCASHGLQLCDKSCANAGCRYDYHPVFTNIPCDAPAPPPPPSATPPAYKQIAANKDCCRRNRAKLFGAKKKPLPEQCEAICDEERFCNYFSHTTRYHGGLCIFCEECDFTGAPGKGMYYTSWKRNDHRRLSSTANVTSLPMKPSDLINGSVEHSVPVGRDFKSLLFA